MKLLKWLYKLVVFLLVGLFLIAGASVIVYTTQKAPPAPEVPQTYSFNRKIPADKLKDDISFLIKTLEEVHPDLYASVSPDTILLYRNRIEKNLTTPMTRIDFYKLTAPLLAQFEDGHTGVRIPNDEFSKFRKSGGPAFPFTVRYRKEAGLEIETSYLTSNGNLPAPGDRILEINGMPADSIFTVFRNGLSGKRMSFRNRGTANYFRSLLWLYEIYAPYQIKYQNPGNNSIRTAKIDGISRNEILRQDSLAGSPSNRQDPYSYSLLPNGIAYIDFRSMTDENQFASFLEETFTDIREKSPEGLIIDLRNNGGGNSSLGRQLLNYITNKPYTMNGGKAWKITEQYKEYFRQHLSPWIRWVSYPPAVWVVRLFRSEAKIMTVENGKTMLYQSGLVTPGSNALRYNGKVCFLIGSGTFSSAMMLANAVEDNSLATLVGEETGGTPNHFGELFAFYLPNSKLIAYASTAKFIRANGNAEDPNGVLPDIKVASFQTIRSENGSDPVFETAKNWIKSNGG